MSDQDCRPVFGRTLNILELYSGIGGMHFAIKNLPITYNLIAIDVNNVANAVYNHNHKNCQQLQRNINSIDEKDFDDWAIDLLTMSPPCQPFTRLGLKKDTNDYRSDSFVHLMQVLLKVQNLPGHVLVENVKGFETSKMRDLLVDTLKTRGYDYQEYLLSPNQLNVPNSRLRYYLIAKYNKSLGFKPIDGKLSMSLPSIETKNLCQFCSKMFKCEDSQVHSLEQYLEDLDDQQIEPFLLSEKVLKKYFMILDIVRTDSLSTNCFTKGYSHLIEGAGSVLQTKECDINIIVSQLNRCSTEEQKIQLLKQIGLRFFTWREIANLMCFPQDFGFPDNYSIKQKYRLLGNSVNVKVVEFLLKCLLNNCGFEAQ